MNDLEVLERRPSDARRATPLLFVHGMWHDARCWDQGFMEYFADRGWPSSAVSLRGHGRSPGREQLRWLSFADYVSDLAAVAGRSQQPPVLVAHSMGALVVQKYLETHTAAAVVLLAPSPPYGLFGATLRLLGKHPWPTILGMCSFGLWPLMASPARAGGLLVSSPRTPARLRELHALLQDESFRAYVELLGPGLSERRPHTAPVLVLGAADDAILLRADVRAAAGIYGAQAEFVDGSAHDMMLDTSWRVVAGRVHDWLAQLPASASASASGSA